MFLGIPYHAALFFSVSGWVVRSTETSAIFDFLLNLSHAFRMPAFYCLAGFFSGLLLTRRSALDWWKDRLIRLGVPLIFGIALFSAPQAYLEARVAAGRAGADATSKFMTLFLHPSYRWLYHLWFLVPLLWMCAIIAVLHIAFPALSRLHAPKRVQDWFANRFTFTMFGLAGALAVYELGAEHLFLRLNLFNNVAVELAHLADLVRFLPFFALGVLLSRADGALARFTRPAPALWILGFFSTCAYATSTFFHEHWNAIVAFSAISGLFMTHVVVSGAKRWFDRPSRSLDRIVAASFGVYLLHQPLMEALGVALNNISGPIFVKFLSLCGAVFALSYLGSRAARMNEWSNLIINGVKPQGLTTART